MYLRNFIITPKHLKIMLCIGHQHTNPYFNLATEEYFLKNFTDECFMLWRNGPSIIVGKHQNTSAEINVEYVKKNDIKVVRRLSGGGAVFHDLGNLNFTFIMNGKDQNLIDFHKYTAPIIEVLQQLGIDARFEGRNDITIGGKKFSGNAEHVWKKRILHHGTLLFSSKMADLSEALRVNPKKYTDKAVKSVRSRVTNISEHLKEPLSLEKFTEMIMQHIMQKYDDSVRYELSAADQQKINQLVAEKYSKWEWNFGYSPDYNFKETFKTPGGTIEVNLDVQKGMIRDARIFGDYFNQKPTADIENALRGVPHRAEKIQQALSKFDFNDYFNRVSLEEFMRGLF